MTNRSYHPISTKLEIEEGGFNEDAETDAKEYSPSETVIRTVTKPQFGFPVVKTHEDTVLYHQLPIRNHVQISEYFDSKKPIRFEQSLSRVYSEEELNQNSKLLKRSQSSSNGALFNLKQSMRALEAPQAKQQMTQLPNHTAN